MNHESVHAIERDQLLPFPKCDRTSTFGKLKPITMTGNNFHVFEEMTLQELQKQVLQLSTHDRWQLVQALLESLKQETEPKPKRGNLSRLKGIAKTSDVGGDAQEEYVDYLIEKAQ